MRLTLCVVPRRVLLAALLVFPSAAMAQEQSPDGRGSPDRTENPSLDHDRYGGDAGSPWPVSIGAGPGSPPSTLSIPPAPGSTAAGPPTALADPTTGVPWLEPFLELLPGSLPRVLWLPLGATGAGIGEAPLPGGRGAPLLD